MKRCFMWDAAQPFVISHLDCCSSHHSRLVKYSVQQLQTIQRCSLPCLQPPQVPLCRLLVCTPPPSPLAASGCLHQILNSGPGTEGSSGRYKCIQYLQVIVYPHPPACALCSATTGHLAVHSLRRLRHRFTWP